MVLRVRKEPLESPEPLETKGTEVLMVIKERLE